MAALCLAIEIPWSMLVGAFSSFCLENTQIFFSLDYDLTVESSGVVRGIRLLQVHFCKA